jgi:hypothetical protein
MALCCTWNNIKILMLSTLRRADGWILPVPVLVAKFVESGHGKLRDVHHGLSAQMIQA